MAKKTKAPKELIKKAESKRWFFNLVDGVSSVFGYGETYEEALEDAKKTATQWKKENPGTPVTEQKEQISEMTTDNTLV